MIWYLKCGYKLANHVKNNFANSLLYLFTLSILIILLVIVFIRIKFHYFLKLVSCLNFRTTILYIRILFWGDGEPYRDSYRTRRFHIEAWRFFQEILMISCGDIKVFLRSTDFIRKLSQTTIDIGNLNHKDITAFIYIKKLKIFY